MEYPINISKDGEKDLQTGKCFYRFSGLEDDFNTDFIGQIAYLKSNPFLFKVYYRNVRRLHFQDFNYSIHYLIREQNVSILRILNHKQDSE